MAKMSKQTPKRSEAKTPVQRWMLGVFVSAATGDHISVYCRKDGTVAPLYAKSVKTKKALFHSAYKGITYAEAREQLLKDAAKAGVKPPKVEKKEETSSSKLRRAA